MLTNETLKQRQSLPLEAKVAMSKKRIREWYEYWNGQVYVSFSGGKDSTVLLSLVRDLYPNVLAVFYNTGLEYPEVQTFISQTDNVKWIMPNVSFFEVIKKYGYPVVSKENSQKIYQIRNTKSNKLRNKRMNGDNNKYKSGKLPEKWKYLIDAPFKISPKCCDIFKKRPAHKFEKESGLHGYIGTMAENSAFRKQSYLRYSCNSYDGKVQSRPLSFWNEQDIWDYIKLNNIEYSSIYDMGYKNTGCVYCMFGVHLDGCPNRFQRMERTHPHLHKYCIKKLGCGKVLDILGIPYTNKQGELF